MREHLKLSLLFFALFYSIVMLEARSLSDWPSRRASQALQIEMHLPIAIGISMTKATILNAPFYDTLALEIKFSLVYKMNASTIKP